MTTNDAMQSTEVRHAAEDGQFAPNTATAGSTASGPGLAPGASVVVQIFQIQTNTTPGNSTINIKETVNTSIGFTSFQVTTFPTGFYFNGLTATVQSGSALVPVAQVLTGATVTLVWNSSVVDTNSFIIYYSSASQGQQTATPTTLGEWTSSPLTSDTVFTVVVTVSVEGGQPLTASMSTAVAVQNPNLIAAVLRMAPETSDQEIAWLLGENVLRVWDKAEKVRDTLKYKKPCEQIWEGRKPWKFDLVV